MVGGADDLDLARAFDGFLADEPDFVASDVRKALLLVELGPLLFDRRLTSFSNLGAAEQLTHWQGWIDADSALRRQVALAFRKFLSLVYFDQDKVWPHIGYPGPKFGPAVAGGTGR